MTKRDIEINLRKFVMNHVRIPRNWLLRSYYPREPTVQKTLDRPSVSKLQELISFVQSDFSTQTFIRKAQTQTYAIVTHVLLLMKKKIDLTKTFEWLNKILVFVKISQFTYFKKKRRRNLQPLMTGHYRNFIIIPLLNSFV